MCSICPYPTPVDAYYLIFLLLETTLASFLLPQIADLNCWLWKANLPPLLALLFQLNPLSLARTWIIWISHCNGITGLSFPVPLWFLWCLPLFKKVLPQSLGSSLLPTFLVTSPWFTSGLITSLPGRISKKCPLQASYLFLSPRSFHSSFQVS